MATLRGINGNDRIENIASGDKTIIGLLGNDWIKKVASADDLIYGDGTGLSSQDGDDAIYAGGGNDTVYGGGGRDWVDGGLGEDKLHGQAGAEWWQMSKGRYQRGQTPVVGSVLVFRRTARLPDGHVAVVLRVVSDRRILVTHASWVRHRVSENVPVIDGSAANDWTRVRVWWPPAGQIGITEYSTFGFIAAEDPPRSDQIAANTQTVINSATRD